MSDDSGEVVARAPLKLEQDRPWWQHVFGAIFLGGLVVTLVLFAVGSFLDRQTGRIANADLRTVANELKAQYDDVKSQNDELVKANQQLKTEQECRAQLSANLNSTTAAIVREKSRLDVVVARAVFERRSTAAEEVEPFYGILNELTDQSAKDEMALRSAVEDCRAK